MPSKLDTSCSQTAVLFLFGVPSRGEAKRFSFADSHFVFNLSSADL